MPVFIIATARTPIGSFGGSLKSLSSSFLAARAIEETLRIAGVPPSQIRETILGCAIPAGCGGNPAHAAGQLAGVLAPAFTISMREGSGLKALMLGAQSLAGDVSEFVLVGGAESSTQTPFLVPEGRWGTRIGSMEILDGLLVDGPYGCPASSDIDLEAQSAWVQLSQHRMKEAQAARQRECFPLIWEGKRGALELRTDEIPEPTNIAFRSHYATPADGAAMVLMSTFPSQCPRARLLGYVASAYGLKAAINQLLLQTELSFESVDRWEIHEASAALILGSLGEMPELNPATLNARGGALALGDPCGASGTRMLISLLHTLEDEGLSTGIVAVSMGQGLALAMAISRS
ncbi:MAG: hypothetical protein Q8O00_01580 [Holophaga sp.]|nr:hypothetical protein [Holophaga sp.]